MTDEATRSSSRTSPAAPARKAQIGCPQGGKTGTTDKNIDAWFVGFTPKCSTAVWVGFPGSAKISMNGMYFGSNIDGGTYPAADLGRLHEEGRRQGLRQLQEPKKPFHSQPFLGHYSREGLAEEEDKDPSAAADDATTRRAPRTPRRRRAGDDKPGTRRRATPTATAATTADVRSRASTRRRRRRAADADPSGGTQAPAPANDG